MKKYFICILFVINFASNGQTITHYAGGGPGGGVDGIGDGLTKDSAIIKGGEGFFDYSGNFYLADNIESRIRKINSAGKITSIAGTGINGYNGDNIQATAAQLNMPISVKCDQHGNLYISDSHNSRIRKIDITTGIISTIAGNGTAGYAGDGGPSTASTLNSTAGICFDKHDNLYICDWYNHCIRKINNTGIITTFAGNGSNGFSGDGGPATHAQLFYPNDITSDDTGNIYILDFANYRIRKVDTFGNIYTIAGNGSYGYSGDGGTAVNAEFHFLEYGLLFDTVSHNLYVNDFYNDRIRRIDKHGIISTIAGTGVVGYSGDGGLATAAQINHPGVANLDTCGNLYFCDLNYVIRKIEFDFCPGTNEVNKSYIINKLVVYPNPIIDNLNIDNLKTPSTYQLTNLIGKTTLQGTLKEGNNTISLQYLPPGMYLLELIGEDGERVVRKVVKE